MPRPDGGRAAPSGPGADVSGSVVRDLGQHRCGAVVVRVMPPLVAAARAAHRRRPTGEKLIAAAVFRRAWFNLDLSYPNIVRRYDDSKEV